MQVSGIPIFRYSRAILWTIANNQGFVIAISFSGLYLGRLVQSDSLLARSGNGYFLKTGSACGLLYSSANANSNGTHNEQSRGNTLAWEAIPSFALFARTCDSIDRSEMRSLENQLRNWRQRCQVNMTQQEMTDIVNCLFDSWHPRLVRYAYRLTNNRALAQDVVQDSFMQLYQALGAGKKIHNPRAWTLCVVRREVG